MATLALQMTEWKDVIQLVGSTLGNSGLDCTLEFLQILPEEVTEGRKINLTVRRARAPPACEGTLSALHSNQIVV